MLLATVKSHSFNNKSAYFFFLCLTQMSTQHLVFFTKCSFKILIFCLSNTDQCVFLLKRGFTCFHFSFKNTKTSIMRKRTTIYSVSVDFFLHRFILVYVEKEEELSMNVKIFSKITVSNVKWRNVS